MNNNIDIKANICSHIKNFIDNTPKMSNYKFADLVGASETSVRGWKKADYAPSSSLLPRIADVIGISLIELLGLDQDNCLSPEDKDLLKLYATDSKFKNIVDKIKSDSSLKDALHLIVNNSK